jgi:hypothetical protein
MKGSVRIMFQGIGDWIFNPGGHFAAFVLKGKRKQGNSPRCTFPLLFSLQLPASKSCEHLGISWPTWGGGVFSVIARLTCSWDPCSGCSRWGHWVHRGCSRPSCWWPARIQSQALSTLKTGWIFHRKYSCETTIETSFFSKQAKI